MKLDIHISEDMRPEILVSGRPWIEDVGIWVYLNGVWHRDGDGVLVAGSWKGRIEEGASGPTRVWQRSYFLKEEPLLVFTIKLLEKAIKVVAELVQSISGLRRNDSFDNLTFLAPVFTFSKKLKFFAVTFGLGPSNNRYPEGYWPSAVVGHGPTELPKQAFAPLVIYDTEEALAIAPANCFLTSALIQQHGVVGRGLHGAVDSLPSGFRIETVFVPGVNVPDSLYRLGDLLMAKSGKTRPKLDEHLFLSTLGYWNAFGSYYTELIRPMKAELLLKLVDYFNRTKIPVRYFGLDCWYPYYLPRGQILPRFGAIRYRADQRKYPKGLAHIRTKTKIPYVLHLMVLAQHNEYRADRANPEVYETIAQEVEDQGGIAVWHDFLRTQQALCTALRSDPIFADKWFSGMANAFAEKNLPMMLCMQTMGMILASTQHKNIVAARSYDDFLVSQIHALRQAALQSQAELRKILLDGWVPPRVMHEQNLLMGMVIHALGLAPFHDLFLTRQHPGFGGKNPEEEAILRVLSCGPLGIGDGLGMSDPNLIRRLVFPNGEIAHPDHPPFPLQESLCKDVKVFWTERKIGEVRWFYLIALNTTEEEMAFQIDPPISKFIIWDPLKKQTVKTLRGRLPAGRLTYFILAPIHQGIAPIGLIEKLVPVPTAFVNIQTNNKEWRICYSVPDGPIAIWSPGPIKIKVFKGKFEGLTRVGDVWLCHIRGSECDFSVRSKA